MTIVSVNYDKEDQLIISHQYMKVSDADYVCNFYIIIQVRFSFFCIIVLTEAILFLHCLILLY